VASRDCVGKNDKKNILPDMQKLISDLLCSGFNIFIHRSPQ
jgi:hypothetical protein